MINIQRMIDDAKCYEIVRELRWPDGVRCIHFHMLANVKQKTIQPILK